MVGRVANGGSKFELRLASNQASDGLFLGRADLKQEKTARGKVTRCLRDDASHHGKTVRPAVKRKMRFKVSHAAFQVRDVAARDIRGVAQNRIKTAS